MGYRYAADTDFFIHIFVFLERRSDYLLNGTNTLIEQDVYVSQNTQEHAALSTIPRIRGISNQLPGGYRSLKYNMRFCPPMNLFHTTVSAMETLFYTNCSTFTGNYRVHGVIISISLLHSND